VNPLRLFRALIAAQVGVVVLGILATVRLERTLPAALQAYLHAEKEAPLRAGDAAFASGGLLLAAAMVVAWVALLRFWRIGPWLYLATTVTGVVLTLASGPTVTSAIGSALDTASSIIAGVLLSMSFFSDLRGKFGRDPARGDR